MRDPFYVWRFPSINKVLGNNQKKHQIGSDGVYFACMGLESSR